MLFEYGLMSLVPLLLFLRVEMLALRIRHPYVIFILLHPLLFLDFLHLALCLLLQLVSQGHEEVALPDIELSL